MGEMAEIIANYVKTRITEHWTDAKKYAPPSFERALCITRDEKGSKDAVVDYAVGGMWHGKNVIAWTKLPAELVNLEHDL